MSTPEYRRLALAATLVYLLIAGVWILASDRLLDLLFEPKAMARWQTWKGLLFVAFTAIALYVLLRWAGTRAEGDATRVHVEPAAHAWGRWSLVGLGLYVLLLAAAALLVWRGLGEAVLSVEKHALHSAAIVQAGRVQDWFGSRLELGRSLATDPSLEWAGNASGRPLPAVEKAGALGAWLVTKGQSPVGGPPPAAAVHAKAVLAAGGGPAWTAVEHAGAPLLVLTVPRSATGAVNAAIVLAFDPARGLERRLRRLPLPQADATAMLLWTEGEYVLGIGPSRATAGVVLHRVPLRTPEALPVLALQRQDLIHRGIDHRGRIAIGAQHPVRGTPFSLLISLEASALDARRGPLAWWFVATVAVLLAAAGAFARGWWRVQGAERRAVLARLDHLARYARDGVALVDMEQRIVDVNDSAAAFVGLSRETVIGRSIAEFFAPATLARLPSLWTDATGAEGALLELDLERADGGVTPVEVSARPVLIRERQYLQVLLRDIGERRRAQARIERLTRLYATLSRSNAAVVRARTPGELLDTCCRVATEEGGFRLAWIGFVDAASREVPAVASAGSAAGYLARVRVSSDASVVTGRGLVGRAVREGRSQVASDFLADPTTAPWREYAAEAGVRSAAAIPFEGRGTTGVLSVYSADPDAFDPESVALLEEITGDLAYGLRRFELVDEREAALARAREVASRLQALVTSAPVAIVTTDLDDRVREWNPAAERMFGWSADEAVGQVLPILPPGEAAWSDSLRARIASGDGVAGIDIERRCKDGAQIPVSLSAAPLRAADGTVTGFLAILEDVSARRTAQAALAASELRLRLALSAAQQGLFDYDIVTGTMVVNDGYARMLGHDPADFHESRDAWRARLHPDDRERAAAYLDDYLAGRHPEYRAEFRLRTASGDWRWILSVGAVTERDTAGRPLRMLGTHVDITERRVAAARLTQERERLDRILRGTRAGTWEWNVQSGELLVNERWADICGYALVDLAPLDIGIWQRLVHPEDLVRSDELIARHFAGELAYYDCECRMRHKDGRWVWIQDRGRVFEWTADGRPLWMAGTHVDITARKLAEEELRASEARFRELFEANPHPMWVYDLDTLAFLAVNDAAVAHYGYTREEFLAMTIADIRPPQDVPAVLRAVRQVTSGIDAAGLWRHRRRDGSLIEVEISSHTLRYGERPAEVVLASDVTERNAARRALESEERKFRTLAEQSLVGIYMIDAERVVYFNPRAAEIFGYAADDVAGVPLRALVADEDWPLVHANVARRLSGDIATLQYEFRGRRQDGGTVMIGVHGSVTEVDGRRVVMGVLQDITAKLAAERQLLEYVGRLERAMFGTVEAVSQMVEMRDPYTAGHERRVGELAAAIAAEMGLEGDVQKGLRIAGGVHDVGKITVPAEILVKPTRLTAIEFELIKNHAAQGYEILKNVEFPWPVAEVARQHHERMDGSGYPRGLKDGDILLEARIIAVADVVESMASHRPYRPTLGIDVALAEIEANRGRWYDPAVADACLRLFRERGYTLVEPR